VILLPDKVTGSVNPAWIHGFWQRGMAAISPFGYRVFSLCLVLVPIISYSSTTTN